MRSGKLLSIIMLVCLGGGLLCSVGSLHSIWASGHFDLGMIAPVLFVAGARRACWRSSASAAIAAFSSTPFTA